MDWKEKKVLCLGDSLTRAGIWYRRLEENLGCAVTAHCGGGLKMREIIDGGESAEGWLDPVSPELFKDKDLVIFFAGYNDREKGSAAQIRDALGYCIDRIFQELDKAENLSCRLLLVTPHCVGRYAYIREDGYEEYPPGSGMTLRKFAKVMEETARDYSVPVCNLWEKSGICRYTWKVFAAAPGSDEVHCSEKGYERIGDVISGAVVRSFG